jgi:Kef-type K+ transport system membrane component KefB
MKTELPFWQFVAESRSSEAFVALCLLTVAGTSLITQKLGFSDTVCPI